MLSEILSLAVPIAVIAGLLLFFAYYLYVMRPASGSCEWISLYSGDRFSLSGKRFQLDRRDILPIIIITAVFAAVSFLFLGSHTAPESFYRFEKEKSAVIEIDGQAEISEIMYYTGLVHGTYTLELSEDGVNWSVFDGEDGISQPHGELFKWRTVSLSDYGGVRFLRLSAEKDGMELGELALYSGGVRISSDYIASAPRELFDEQKTVPFSPSWYNGMVFDEIYHGRTAYEYLRGIYPYEITHPPLGKIIISAGIALFGMNPFGWRFSGTLFGVLLLPLLYIMLKWLFGKRCVAVCGTLITAFDFMRFTQSRLGTIDTYSVLFTLLAFMFMYRFITEPYDAPLRKGLPALFLSGLFFGIGASCKWTGFYAGAGLAVVYAVHLILTGRHYVNSFRGDEFVRRLFATFGLSFVFFVIIPAVIYYLSYIPCGLARGCSPLSREYLDIVTDNQSYMFSYHGNLEATHPYQSRWYQWMLDVRPILYYRDIQGDMKSAIAAFLNPALSWGGLGAVIMLICRTFYRRDGRALFILIGYAAVLLPWVIIPRCAFEYHYFPASLFLCLALAHVFDTLTERSPRGGITVVYAFTGCTGLIFAAFFPVLSGISVPIAYTDCLKWLYLPWPI